MSSSDDEFKATQADQEDNDKSAVPKASANKKEGDEKKEGDAEQAEILDNLPPEAKKIMEMAISSQSFIGKMPNPILSKITPEHIDKILDQSAKEEDNDFKLETVGKRYNLAYFVIIILLIVFLVVYLADRNKELLQSLGEKAIYILAGFAGGYGFKTYKDKEDS